MVVLGRGEGASLDNLGHDGVLPPPGLLREQTRENPLKESKASGAPVRFGVGASVALLILLTGSFLHDLQSFAGLRKVRR